MTPEMEEFEIKNTGVLMSSGGVGGSGITGDLGGGGTDDDGLLDPDAPGLPGMPDFGPGSVLGFPF